jgi:hypothetical protein
MLKYLYDPSGNVVVRTNIPPPQITGQPEITGQPVVQIAEPGDVATFSVTVSDTSAVTFQWKFKGTDIVGATGDSLLLTNVSDHDEGQYSAVVTNSAGSVTSAPAALMLDRDRDGLPDSWEIDFFRDTTSQRSENDPDGDGISNLDEFFDGTNPTAISSLRPRLIAYSNAGGSVTVAPMKLSYVVGERVTLTATPFAPSVFVGWTGDLNNVFPFTVINPVNLTMKGNMTVRASFASPVPIPPGLVAWWRGETDASDLIGGHDGTFFTGSSVTAPRVTADGKVGGAFSFDGTVHVRVPDSAALKPAQITVEAWVFPTVLSSILQMIIARGSSTDDSDTWYLGVFNGKPRFISHGAVLLEGPNAIPLNQWTHLAISFDGTTKLLYVNGAQVAAQSGLGALIYDAAAVPVTIGSDWAFNASSALFNGRVDEVSLYRRALSSAEVFSLADAGPAGKSTV